MQVLLYFLIQNNFRQFLLMFKKTTGKVKRSLFKVFTTQYEISIKNIFINSENPTRFLNNIFYLKCSFQKKIKINTIIKSRDSLRSESIID